MNRQTWLAVLSLIGVAAIYVLFIRKTDEDRIRGQLAALGAAVQEDEGDNLLLRAARIERQFPHLFLKEVELHVPDVSEGRRARRDLATYAAGSGKLATRIELRFSSVHVELERAAQGTQRAWVTADATVAATLREGGARRETRPLSLRFEKDEEEWKIADVALQGAGAR
jgi:hypothetical protein